MKKTLFLISFLFAQAFAFAQGVEFVEENIDQVLATAKKTNKYVFIDFYTSWCGPCKMMDKQIFPQPKVGEYFDSKFVSMKVNAEKEGVDLAKKYGIKAYPTFVVLDRSGELQHIFAGGILDADRFIAAVENSFDPKKAYGVLKKKYDAGDRSVALQSAYIQALITTHTENPQPLVDAFYNKLSTQQKVSKDALFVYEFFAPLDSEKAKFFEANRAQFRKVADAAKVDSILRSKYEQYFGTIVKGYAPKTTVADIDKIKKHVASLGIKDSKALPVYASGAKLKLTNTGKEEFLNTLKATTPKLTDNEKDMMLYMVLPGLKTILTDQEKQNLLAMVSNDDVKGYIERSVK